VEKEAECWSHINSEPASKIDIKNTFFIPIPYPQQKIGFHLNKKYLTIFLNNFCDIEKFFIMKG